MTILWLSGNSIGDDGAKAIAEALKVNPVLTELNLRSNRIPIRDDGAKAIAEALKVNPVLKNLRKASTRFHRGAASRQKVLELSSKKSMLTGGFQTHALMWLSSSQLMSSTIKMTTPRAPSESPSEPLPSPDSL